MICRNCGNTVDLDEIGWYHPDSDRLYTFCCDVGHPENDTIAEPLLEEEIVSKILKK